MVMASGGLRDPRAGIAFVAEEQDHNFALALLEARRKIGSSLNIGTLARSHSSDGGR
jgi:hypothetical protein